jgi:hypothetical protein
MGNLHMEFYIQPEKGKEYKCATIEGIRGFNKAF